MPVNPVLTLQTASLYASNDASTFTGTGGPFGFDIFTAQFGGVVSSAGLAREPFADTVYGVAPGDIVTFVVAVQNMTAGAAAYGVRLRETMPPGFIVPTDSSGIDLSITDGAGNVLAVSGDLFGGGLTLTNPIAGYDANSGSNVALITFTLQAAPSLPGLYNSLCATAAITADTAYPGGPDLSAGVAASTTIVTAAPTPIVTPETDPAAVAKGQTIAFDVALTLPAGTLHDLRITPVLPAGIAMLDLVSVAVVQTGAGLTLGTPQIAADGSVHFGDVFASAAGNNKITVRIVLRADGTASGPATLQSVISATDPNSPGGVWSTTVASTVGVVAPPAPPVLAGLSSSLNVTITTTVRPFASLAITDSVANQSATLAITLQDSTLGRLGNAPAGSLDVAGATFVISGTIAAVLSAAQQLIFTPARAGAEHFTLTVVDGVGGIAQDATTLVTIAASNAPNSFSSPRYSDLLLQNDNGAIVIWSQANLAITAGALVGNPGPTWHTVSVADFNGDGHPDLLLQNNTGAIVDYLMTGTTITAGNYLGNAGPSWHVRGVADFNRDGAADILLQNDNGTLVIWTTNGTTVTGGSYLGDPGPGWTVEGVADFNGDGQPDLLLQNTNGALVDYIMSGVTIASGNYLGNPGPGWAVAGTGEYSGNSKAGILLHHDGGADVLWETNGSVVTAGAYLGNPGATYSGAVAGPDLYGNGSSGLIVQHTGSALVGYAMSGGVITAGAYLGTPGVGWHAVGNNPIQFIDGTQGNTNLAATPGPDQFDLTTFAGGLQQITGFDPAQDTLALSAATFTNYAGLLNNEQPYQGGTFIALTPGTTGAAVVILGITPDHLSAANFVLR